MENNNSEILKIDQLDIQFPIFGGVFQKTIDAFSLHLDGIREDPMNKDLEWLIWLADRVTEYEVSGAGTLAAHVEFKNWKPPLRK